MKNIFIGPEGGWSETEKTLFREKNLRFQTLGTLVFPAWLAGYTWFCKNISD
jgi:16S rRNA U1498 N3-methylase RsmE